MCICSVACAETPDFVLSQSDDSHSEHGHGHGPDHEDGDNHAQNGTQAQGSDDSDTPSDSDVVSTKAFAFTALCGEGFLTSSFKETKIYIGKKPTDDTQPLSEQEFLIRVEYSAFDGDSLNDGRLKFYYEKANELTPVASSLNEADDTKVVLTGVVLDGDEEVKDPSLLTEVLNAEDETLTNSYKSYYKVNLQNSFDFSMDSADPVDFLIESIESVIVAGVGHYHFPRCMDVTFENSVEDFDFNL